MPQYTSSLHAFDLRSVVLFTCLTLGGTSAVLAQQASPAPQTPPAANQAPAAAPQKALTASEAFARSDLDHDQALSRAEAQNLPSVADQFDAWDTDGNGQLSQEEFLLGVQKTQ